ncbi:MAG: hypothetical protein COV72_01770 [Candidatus Omnitrophica bacterium CG11_big_fil_rev_8_21_14_0_20_42_13]|uniref:Uncharacterized protein n=1 Tax=Candidatus Ghiorseimicrobium undicola TaxID=1974746 RepID=A0A2H0LZ63_9BACT|nr:MAG: hypothetical protein COV72_01770 [Candidatus Omnitrophica bacterium CG11_big_fil_rev_8_21_14_0_20_42_13]
MSVAITKGKLSNIPWNAKISQKGKNEIHAHIKFLCPKHKIAMKALIKAGKKTSAFKCSRCKEPHYFIYRGRKLTDRQSSQLIFAQIAAKLT